MIASNIFRFLTYYFILQCQLKGKALKKLKFKFRKSGIRMVDELNHSFLNDINKCDYTNPFINSPNRCLISSYIQIIFIKNIHLVERLHGIIIVH